MPEEERKVVRRKKRQTPLQMNATATGLPGGQQRKRTRKQRPT
jgi:hypothetical protein